MGTGLAATRVLMATVLVNLGLAGIVGAWASLLWLHEADSAWAVRARLRSRAAFTLALAFTAGVDLLLLWQQAAYMAEASLADALAMLPSMAVQTYAGRCWTSGMAGLLLVGAASASARRWRVARWAGVAVGISVFVASRAAVSHAGGAGLLSLPLWVECVHLWAISLWLGIVAVGAFVVLDDRVGAGSAEPKAVLDWVETLSTVATGTLVVVGATGLANAWRSVGATASLTGSAYGNALLAKVALVALAVALGGFNRFRVMPRLRSAMGASPGLFIRLQRRFVRVLRIEAVVLFAALVAAAVLSSSPLPAAT